MPYNGSGTYNGPSLPGSWNPAVAGQAATPTDWNTLLADLSTALSSVITKDGQTTVTADIPFNTHKLTQVAPGTAATDAANVGQLLGTASGVNDTGAADAYVIAPSPAISAYAAYQNFQFKAANTNTGASTLAVSGLAAKAIKHLDGSALLAGDIVSGELVNVAYDGTNFQLLSATGMRGTASTWRAAQAWTAASQFGGTTTMVAAAFNNAVRVDVASATTTDIGAAASNYVRVTGTTTITGLGTIASGAEREVLFAGILILTHNATSLILPTGANITTAAGDTALFVSEGSGNWRCVNYQRASGAALATSSNPQIVAMAKATGVTLNKQYNVSGAVKNSTGNYTFSFSANIDANAVIVAAARDAAQSGDCVITAQSASAVTIVTYDASGTPTDFTGIYFTAAA